MLVVGRPGGAGRAAWAGEREKRSREGRSEDVGDIIARDCSWIAGGMNRGGPE